MILALDASTKSTGYAIFDKEKLIQYGYFTASSSDLLCRLDKMKKEIIQIIERAQSPIECVILEEVRPELGNNIKTYKALMWLQAMIVLLMHEKYNLKVEFLYPSEWRKVCGITQGRGIKREQLKQEDISYIKTAFNIQEDINDDTADAIGIGYAYIQKNFGDNTQETLLKW